jgi:hypothetical protein
VDDEPEQPKLVSEHTMAATAKRRSRHSPLFSSKDMKARIVLTRGWKSILSMTAEARAFSCGAPTSYVLCRRLAVSAGKKIARSCG